VLLLLFLVALFVLLSAGLYNQSPVGLYIGMPARPNTDTLRLLGVLMWLLLLQEFHPYVFQILAQLIDLSDAPLGPVSGAAAAGHQSFVFATRVQDVGCPQRPTHM
jgi:hypothetical protein